MAKEMDKKTRQCSKTLRNKLNIRQHELHKGIKQKQQQTQQKTDKNIKKLW